MQLAVRGMVFAGLAAGPVGGEVVLLLHGFPQFADLWVGVMGVLAAAGFRVVAVVQWVYSAGARPGSRLLRMLWRFPQCIWGDGSRRLQPSAASNLFVGVLVEEGR